MSSLSDDEHSSAKRTRDGLRAFLRVPAVDEAAEEEVESVCVLVGVTLANSCEALWLRFRGKGFKRASLLRLLSVLDIEEDEEKVLREAEVGLRVLRGVYGGGA